MVESSPLRHQNVSYQLLPLAFKCERDEGSSVLFIKGSPILTERVNRQREALLLIMDHAPERNFGTTHPQKAEEEVQVYDGGDVPTRELLVK